MIYIIIIYIIYIYIYCIYTHVENNYYMGQIWVIPPPWPSFLRRGAEYNSLKRKMVVS